jgi:hypothetical protein
MGEKSLGSNRGKKTYTLKIKNALPFDILIVRCG